MSETADGRREGKALTGIQQSLIAAFDFFAVPTLTFRVLYGFFVIEHHRRRILHILHFNTTAYPTGDWIVQ
jgi:hypothetical protein